MRNFTPTPGTQLFMNKYLQDNDTWTHITLLTLHPNEIKGVSWTWDKVHQSFSIST